MNSRGSENAQSTAKVPTIDVVIVNYNSGQVLAQCVQSLLQGPQREQLNLIVVDNGSEDNSLETIAQFDSAIVLLQNTENTGFARACNQGAMSAHNEHIAFVNPDCFVQPSQLHKLVQTLKSHTKAALVGCRVLNDDGSLQKASQRRLPTFWRVLFHVTQLAKLPFFQGINIKGPGKFAQPIAVEAVNGACYVVNRPDFENIKGFDEGFPLHFEDLDLFARLAGLNKILMYDSSVEVKHLQGHAKQDSATIKNWKKQGLKRYFNKHRPAWEAKIVNWLL